MSSRVSFAPFTMAKALSSWWTQVKTGWTLADKKKLFGCAIGGTAVGTCCLQTAQLPHPTHAGTTYAAGDWDWSVSPEGVRECSSAVPTLSHSAGAAVRFSCFAGVCNNWCGTEPCLVARDFHTASGSSVSAFMTTLGMAIAPNML